MVLAINVGFLEENVGIRAIMPRVSVSKTIAVDMGSCHVEW
jgi:hypothetical protein